MASDRAVVCVRWNARKGSRASGSERARLCDTGSRPRLLPVASRGARFQAENRVRTQSAPHVGPWLKSSPERSDAKIRLFVFPYAGGAPAAFRTWPDALAPQVEPHFVALPGRERRFHEAPITRSDEIVAPVATAIASFDQRPFVLFGHSMGSMLAFEVARQLRRSGRRDPAALVVSGGAPRSSRPARRSYAICQTPN